MEDSTAVAQARAFLSEEKDGAAWLALIDVGDFLNFSGIARKYFGRSGSWLLQRLHGYNVNGKTATFKTKEYKVLEDALRSMASQLNEAADRIGRARDPEQAND